MLSGGERLDEKEISFSFFLYKQTVTQCTNQNAKRDHRSLLAKHHPAAPLAVVPALVAPLAVVLHLHDVQCARPRPVAALPLLDASTIAALPLLDEITTTSCPMMKSTSITKLNVRPLSPVTGSGPLTGMAFLNPPPTT